jgi:hypothetical protein
MNGEESMEITERERERAQKRLEAERAAGYAVTARYDRRSGRLVVGLNTGVQLAVPVALVQDLADAAPADLAEIEITPAGLGLYWPRLDADVHLPGLMRGVFGTKSWMARQLGAAGGRSRSAAKSAAARTNGRKGGRPPKSAKGA